jgi:heme/copper-type cytochrome/quinol oxidase subunit 3
MAEYPAMAKLRPLTPAKRAGSALYRGDGEAEPFISNAKLAILMLIAGEMMLFSGLIGPFLVYRGEAAFWPPPGLPHLPIFVTWINTFVLMSSAGTMYLAVRAVHQNRQRLLRRWLTITALLGITFLAVQGSEWIRLIAHGLKLSSGTYGATFYTLIGCHGAHVTAAAIWLSCVVVAAARGRYNAKNAGGVELCAMYWYFVCAIWPVLFVLVYLT